MDPTSVRTADPSTEIIPTSINHICEKLKLAPIVREKSWELANILKPEGAGGNEVVDIPESVANAVACAVVSIAHEEAWKIHRVPKHLPDRILGRVYGLSSAAVVYNKHLIGSVIARKKLEMNKGIPYKVRTLR